MRYRCRVSEISVAIEDRRSTEEPVRANRARPTRVVEHHEPEFFVQQITRYGEKRERSICPSCHTYTDSHHCKPTYIERRYTSIFPDKLNHDQLTLNRHRPHFNCSVSDRIIFYRKQFEYLILHKDILRQRSWRDSSGRTIDQRINWAVEALDGLQPRSVAVPITTLNRQRYICQSTLAISNQTEHNVNHRLLQLTLSDEFTRPVHQHCKQKRKSAAKSNELDPYELGHHIEPFDTWATQYIRDVHSGKKPALTVPLNIIYLTYLRDRNEAIRRYHYLSRQLKSAQNQR